MKTYQLIAKLFSPKIRPRRRGAVIVEMAFVVVILLTLTMGLIQWGIITNAAISVTNLSREGARYAAVHSDSDADITSHVKDNSPPGISANDLTVTVTPPEGARPAQSAIHVTVAYDMKKKLFLPAKFFNVTFFSRVFKAEGQMMIEPA